MNWVPRSLRIFWAFTQSAHRPAFLRAASSAGGIAAAYDSLPRRILAARATPDSALGALPLVLASASPFASASPSVGFESPSPGARNRLLSEAVLLGVEIEVTAAERVERLMIASLDDAACFDDQDLIGAADRGKPMRDYERGASAHEIREALLNHGFGFGV